MRERRVTIIKSKILLILAVLVLSFAFVINISAEASFSWYCKRTKDHSQPPLPTEFSFIKEYGGIYIDNKNCASDAENKKVYLTFDVGYENGNVEKVLNVMKDNDVKGAFFILSNVINTSPELVKRMGEEGHLVCNHTSSHQDMSRVYDKEAFYEELENLEKLYKNCTKLEMSKYFRPPEGKFNENTLKYANELGYKTVFWSFAYADWDNGKQMSPQAAKSKILENIHNGAVVLLHPTSKTNAIILDDVIKELKSQGYTFGTLDDIK